MEHGFDSRRRYNFGINSPAWGTWRFRLAARTHASHAWNTSSILVGATIGNNVAELTEKESGTFIFVNILCFSFLSSSIVRIFVAVILNEKNEKSNTNEDYEEGQHHAAPLQEIPQCSHL